MGLKDLCAALERPNIEVGGRGKRNLVDSNQPEWPVQNHRYGSRDYGGDFRSHSRGNLLFGGRAHLAGSQTLLVCGPR